MNRLIVSFTSYPARIDAVKTVLNCLYVQTMKADEIILWLAEDEFPHREVDLPLSLQEDLTAKRFTLRWCDNIGSHKKYFYAMQEYPEDIIVTVDDDTFYHPDTLQTLMDTHVRFPHAVVARTTNLVRFDSDLNPIPYKECLFDYQFLVEPSMLLIAIGVGGVLYPPHSVNKKIFDKDLMLETCMVNGKICGDDILLKVGEMLNQTPVVSVTCEAYYKLPDMQEGALARLMPDFNHTNQTIKKCKERFQDAFDEASTRRLERAISDFNEMDNRLSLWKRYWLAKPSRDLKKQLGYLSLPDAPDKPNTDDYEYIKKTARFAARVFTAFPPTTANDEAAKASDLFRQQMLDIPDIADMAETDVVIRGLIDYGEPLNLECHIIYHGIPIYMRSLKNWQSFLANHPNCEPIFYEGYKTFLNRTEVRIRQAESVLSKTEIDEWKLAYEKQIRALWWKPLLLWMLFKSKLRRLLAKLKRKYFTKKQTDL